MVARSSPPALGMTYNDKMRGLGRVGAQAPASPLGAARSGHRLEVTSSRRSRKWWDRRI
jgi:hypothetical protein